MKKQLFYLLGLLSMLSLGACSVGDEDEDRLFEPQDYSTPSAGDEFKEEFVGHTTITWSYSKNLYSSDEDFFKRTNKVNVDTDFKVTIKADKAIIDHSLVELLLGRRADETDSITVMPCYLKGMSDYGAQEVWGLTPPKLEFEDREISVDGDTTTTRYCYEFSYESQAFIDYYASELTLSLIVAHATVNGDAVPDEEVAGRGWTLTAKRVTISNRE